MLFPHTFTLSKLYEIPKSAIIHVHGASSLPTLSSMSSTAKRDAASSRSSGACTNSTYYIHTFHPIIDTNPQRKKGSDRISQYRHESRYIITSSVASCISPPPPKHSNKTCSPINPLLSSSPPSAAGKPSLNPHIPHPPPHLPCSANSLFRDSTGYYILFFS